jgi:hypothetical protein
MTALELNKPHPTIVGSEEVEDVLSPLVADWRVATSIQGEALSAITFLYGAFAYRGILD